MRASRTKTSAATTSSATSTLVAGSMMRANQSHANNDNTAEEDRNKALNESDRYYFLGRSFYLDLRNFPNIRQKLSYGILQLKGTVEEFLSPEVKYVVTDRAEDTWPKRDQQNQNQQSYASVTGHAVTASASLAPAATAGSGSTAPKVVLSRAKLILDKVASTQQQQQHAFTAPQAMNSASAQVTGLSAAASGAVPNSGHLMPASSAISTMTKSTTDVLETAVRLGVKIIAARKMLDFLDQNVYLPGQQKDDHSPSKMKSIKAIPITGKFIKIEPVDQRAKPLARVFRTWPELVLEPGLGCPFRLPHVAPEIADLMKERRHREQQQNNQSIQSPAAAAAGSPMPLILQPRTPAQDAEAEQQPNKSRIITTTRKAGAAASWSRITPQTISQKNNLSINANKRTAGVVRATQQSVKRKKLFCEVCGTEFENLNDHLRTHDHEKFLNDPDNFKELLSVIKSLPTIRDLEAANLPAPLIPEEIGKENVPDKADMEMVIDQPEVKNRKERKADRNPAAATADDDDSYSETEEEGNSDDEEEEKDRIAGNGEEEENQTDEEEDDDEDEETSAYDLHRLRRHAEAADMQTGTTITTVTAGGEEAEGDGWQSNGSAAVAALHENDDMLL